MSQGLLDLSLWGIAAYGLVVTHITIAGVTIYLHRHQAHRALELHPAVGHFFRFWLWLTTGMVTGQWVAVHRRHHAKCETPGDPHSPQVMGLRKVLLEGAELYRAAISDPETVARYGKGTPDDWLERRVYARHNGLGLVLMLFVDMALFGAPGIVMWAVQMLWIPVLAAGVINGLGHHAGYRNFQTPDASTNLLPWGLLIGGEELHNNHHAYPGSARLSARWWELDIGWVYIRLFQFFRLARVKRLAPRPLRLRGGGALGGDATRDLMAGRLQLLARYGREVLARVHRDELRRTERDSPLRGLLKRTRRLLLQHDALLNEEGRRCLAQALEQSPPLRAAYLSGQRLQAVWLGSHLGYEQRLQALRDWRRQAEASGIEAIQAFARRLGGYRFAVG